MTTETQVRAHIGTLTGTAPGAGRRARRGRRDRARSVHRPAGARRAPDVRHSPHTGRRAGARPALMSALVTTPTAELSTPDLEVALTTLAGHLNAATCRFLVLLGEFDTREGWAMDGISTCAHWLTWRCSLTPGAAREHVRVARAIRDLPQIRAAFGTGKLSYSKVRALTRVATPDREDDLLQMALVTPSGPLERYLRGLRGSLDAESEARRHANRTLTWRWAEDGSLTLTARLSPEDGAQVVEALEAAAARLTAETAGAPPLEEPVDPDRGPYQDRYDVPAGTSTARARADALVTICTQAGDLADDTEPNPTRRPELIVHVNLADS